MIIFKFLQIRLFVSTGFNRQVILSSLFLRRVTEISLQQCMLSSLLRAFFILNSEAQVSKNEFPKLAGVFNQHKDLLLVLEDTLTWFERGKLEVFAFEHDKIFLWSQLWKEEVSE
jgi:hypothetical protein